MKKRIRKTHRAISLAVAAFWLVQVLTGVTLQFHQEIDSLTLPDAEYSLDFDAIDGSLANMLAGRPGSRVPFAYVANGSFGAFDAYVVDASGSYSVLRIDGQGMVHRELPSNPEILDAGLFELVLELHAKLWAGDLGHIIVGVSGFLLFTNMMLGLKLAWPKRGTWKKAVSWPRVTTGPAGMYGFHRALGLAFIVPATLFVGAGVLLAWEDQLAVPFGAPQPAPEVAAVPNLNAVGLAKAVAAAQDRFPQAKVSMFTLPSSTKPYYRIRLLQAGELRRLYGETTVYVDAQDGKVLKAYDALALPVGQRFLNSFYGIHTGGTFGLIGRLLSIITGLWLLAMMVFGLRLWWLRR
ncbi:PepSY-associated TM helix domain-containing protein [Kordiimonas lacus]|uniref:Uncharacterized iron-regulated membrane protein n=1 Tax=Kordiimonas lacus TaxID=637679 RepID=A0A1G7FDJ5_9PROT|nr:PepSY-associated TM helix domain-containing protein [Kordiimonas lacus]SDE74023.1 Uncharacterized iron-regulated membrane protein [Kordiimonas lacus]